jgi:hypothetical protein
MAGTSLTPWIPEQWIKLIFWVCLFTNYEVHVGYMYFKVHHTKCSKIM